MCNQSTIVVGWWFVLYMYVFVQLATKWHDKHLEKILYTKLFAMWGNAFISLAFQSTQLTQILNILVVVVVVCQQKRWSRWWTPQQSIGFIIECVAGIVIENVYYKKKRFVKNFVFFLNDFNFFTTVNVFKFQLIVYMYSKMKILRFIKIILCKISEFFYFFYSWLKNFIICSLAFRMRVICLVNKLKYPEN